MSSILKLSKTQIIDIFNAGFPGLLEGVLDEFEGVESDMSTESIQLSAADPIKKICVVFGVPFNILQGNSNRELRELKKYSIGIHNLTARELLQIVGTEVFRNYNPTFWVDLLKTNLQNFNMVVIPDVRFNEELDLIKSLDGILLRTYRNIDELILTPQDKLTHISNWNFLNFCIILFASLIPFGTFYIDRKYR